MNASKVWLWVPAHSYDFSLSYGSPVLFATGYNSIRYDASLLLGTTMPQTSRIRCLVVAMILWSLFTMFATSAESLVSKERLPVTKHPRLFVLPEDLPRLRSLKRSGIHARIWDNLTKSADWAALQPPRREWIPTISPDPRYENLYDRFYAAMHDAAIVEHLAFASMLSEPNGDRYFEPARAWALATATIWKQEASNQPDASKAYAVLRVLKALAVAYDSLHDRLEESERARIRETLLAVGREYFRFFADPVAAGKGYNKHHGSVDAAPFGVVALALLGEVPEATPWLDRMIEKHVEYLLPEALTPSGTSDQSSNFWASTLQYRIFFMDALRRVTGRNLFREFPEALPGRIALAAVVGKQSSRLVHNEAQRSVLFGPSYGQIDYWSPVLLFLAREQRRSIYQHLALWDESIGQIQRTRYITPTRREELLFTFGGYSYLWYDSSVIPAIEPDLPRSFEFPEPEVNEAYLRSSFEPEGMVIGFQKGAFVIHAGGRPVLVDRLHEDNVNKPAGPADEMLVADDGKHAMIRCVGPKALGVGEQKVVLERPGTLKLRRAATRPLSWWYAGDPKREGNTLTWPDGTRLIVSRGKIEQVDPRGYVESPVHYAGMKFADPHPFTYPVMTVGSDNGLIEIAIILGRM